MDTGTFDLLEFAKWGASKALGQVEQRIGFPIQEHLIPLVQVGFEHFGIDSVMSLEPELVIAGKLIMAGLSRQKELEEQRRQMNDNQSEST
jgi:hypothetical protein